jgi:hypothetical protein
MIFTIVQRSVKIIGYYFGGTVKMKILAIQVLIKKTSLFMVASMIAISSLATAMPFIFAPAAGAVSGSELVYDALPNIDPQISYAGHNYQTSETSQLADSIKLGGSNRVLETVSVTLHSAAEFLDYSSYTENINSWSQEVTVHVYSNHLGENGIPDTWLATRVQSFDIPWSPEGSVNGVTANVVFDFTTQASLVLPDDVIVVVAFNTQNYGAVPAINPGPYDLLSVAVPQNQLPTVGTDADVDSVFLDSTFEGRIAGLTAKSEQTPKGTLALRVTATEFAPVTTGPVGPGTTTPGSDADADGELPATKDDTVVIAAVNPVVPSIINPSTFAGIIVGNSQPTDELDGEAVMGNSTNTVTTTAAATVDSEANQGTFLGVGWYWWLLAIATLVTLAWWATSAARNRITQ